MPSSPASEKSILTTIAVIAGLIAGVVVIAIATIIVCAVIFLTVRRTSKKVKRGYIVLAIGYSYFCRKQKRLGLQVEMLTFHWKTMNATVPILCL